MGISTLTSKGQTTIPRDIRSFLRLQTNDKILYVPEGDSVRMVVVRGDIRGVAGVFKKKGRRPVDFQKLRHQAMKGMARQAAILNTPRNLFLRYSF